MYLSNSPIFLFRLLREQERKEFFQHAWFWELWRFGVAKNWPWGYYLDTRRLFYVFGVRASEFTNGTGFMAGFLRLFGLNGPGLMD